MEKSMIDAANGGALGDMTPAEARNLIEKMASNSQQFSAEEGSAGDRERADRGIAVDFGEHRRRAPCGVVARLALALEQDDAAMPR